MPEGDTIFRSAKSLHRVLSGQVITRFDTAYAHLDRVNVDTPIAGRTFEKCKAAGKHLLMFFSGDLILRTHMRMSGSWHLYRHGERWWRGEHAMRIRIDTDEWVAVAFDVPVAEFITPAELATRDPVAKLGPDLLGDAFDRDEAIRRIVASGHREIAATLLDQRILAGIGNVYKSEVLFMSGVHPDTPSSAVPRDTLELMIDIARGVLRDNVVDGTSPRIQTYRNLRQINPATDHDESLWVYGRRGKPCRKCGTPIEMKKMGIEARSTYWCPRCQKLGSDPDS
jgi:endonuclease VIII